MWWGIVIVYEGQKVLLSGFFSSGVTWRKQLSISLGSMLNMLSLSLWIVLAPSYIDNNYIRSCCSEKTHACRKFAKAKIITLANLLIDGIKFVYVLIWLSQRFEFLGRWMWRAIVLDQQVTHFFFYFFFCFGIWKILSVWCPCFSLVDPKQIYKTSPSTFVVNRKFLGADVITTFLLWRPFLLKHVILHPVAVFLVNTNLLYTTYLSFRINFF